MSPENPMHVAERAHSTEGVFVLAPRSSFRHGKRDVLVRVAGASGFEQITTYRLLGPEDSENKR